MRESGATESGATASADPPNQKVSGLPGRRLASARNTKPRWLTSVKYDLLLFEDRLVVARGISWRTMPKDVAALLRAGSMKRAGRNRVAATQELLPEDVLAQDPANKIVIPEEVASVQLRRRAGFASVVIKLRDGTALRYRWHDIAANGSYYSIHRALVMLFGPKLLP